MSAQGNIQRKRVFTVHTGRSILAKEHKRVQEIVNRYKDNMTSDNLVRFLKTNRIQNIKEPTSQ